VPVWFGRLSRRFLGRRGVGAMPDRRHHVRPHRAIAADAAAKGVNAVFEIGNEPDIGGSFGIKIGITTYLTLIGIVAKIWSTVMLLPRPLPPLAL
jgi:hypothetical protein